jgi:hypothetical protein
MTKILRAVGATFAYKMRGTSWPHAKFTGDFGNAIEVIRIGDRSMLSVFAKNLEPCNFRLLQHNRSEAEIGAEPDNVGYVPNRLPKHRAGLVEPSLLRVNRKIRSNSNLTAALLVLRT